MKYTFIIMLTILLISATNISNAKSTLSSYSKIRNFEKLENIDDENNLYVSDLNRVELHLYGKVNSRQSFEDRIKRIENTLFNRTYTNWTTTARINNILSCYQEVQNMKHYTANYYPTYSPRRRLYNRFMGYPTGFTPPISPNIIDSMMPSITNSYYGTTRGYRYNNSIPPMVGTGVRILD